MQKYHDSVLLQYLSTGTPQIGSGLTVKVYKAGTGTLATIYSDNGITAIDQTAAPVVTDINGNFAFYAADGRYDINISGSGLTTIVVSDIELEDDFTREVNEQTGTTYTFDITDQAKLVVFNNAAATTVTIPPEAAVAFKPNSQIDCIQDGAGKVTFAEGSGVTILSHASNKSIAAQYAGVTLIKKSANVWWLVGNLTA